MSCGVFFLLRELDEWKSALIAALLLTCIFLPYEYRSPAMLSLGEVFYIIYLISYSRCKNEGIMHSPLALLCGLSLTFAYPFLLDYFFWYLLAWFVYISLFYFNPYPTQLIIKKEIFLKINAKSFIISIYTLFLIQIFMTASKFFIPVFEYLSIV